MSRRTLRFLLVWLFMPTVAYSKAPSQAAEDDFIMSHVADAYLWHFTTIDHHHVSLPLPVIVYQPRKGLSCFLSHHLFDAHHQPTSYRGYTLSPAGKLAAVDGRRIYDLSITRNVAAMLLSVVLMLLLFIPIARNYRCGGNNYIPKGLYLALELVILFIRDNIARVAIGEQKYERYLPYLLTVFFFIFFNNLLGLLPGAANVTGDIAITLTLALFTFVITTLSGNKSYWKHVIAPPGVPWPLLPIMIPVEIIGLFTKPFSLMIRLFANITAGHIVLLSIVGLVFIFQHPAASLISVPLGSVMIVLKLIVSFLQAYIFTLLSAVYFGMAVKEEH